MTIGGIDFIFHLPPEIPAIELVLRRVGRLWPEAIVQDADEEEAHPIVGAWALIEGVHRRELIIHRDEAMSASWDRDGMTPENLGSMLLVLGGEPSAVEDGLRQLTLVCGERNQETEQLIRDLEADFGGVEADVPWAEAKDEARGGL